MRDEGQGEGRGLAPTLLDVQVVDDIEQGRDGWNLGREIRSDGSNPRMICIEHPAVGKPDCRSHRTIAPVIVPAIIVGEARDRGTVRARGDAIRRKHE